MTDITTAKNIVISCTKNLQNEVKELASIVPFVDTQDVEGGVSVLVHIGNKDFMSMYETVETYINDEEDLNRIDQENGEWTRYEDDDTIESMASDLDSDVNAGGKLLAFGVFENDDSEHIAVNDAFSAILGIARLGIAHVSVTITE